MCKFGLGLALFLILLPAGAHVSFVDVATLQKFALDSLQNPISLKDTHYATKILGTINTTSFKCNCPVIAKMTAAELNLMDIFYGVSSSTSCGCKIPEIPNDIQSKIKSSLKVSNIFKYCILILFQYLLE
jgi:hypothetical protein